MPAPKMSEWAVSETTDRRWSFWQWLGLVFLVYAIPLIAVGIDADLDERFFDRLPEELQTAVNFVYWPIFRGEL